MHLEHLLTRVQEIETAIVNTTNQLNALYGHKNEAQHWIEQLQKPVEVKSSENDKNPVDSSVLDAVQ